MKKLPAEIECKRIRLSVHGEKTYIIIGIDDRRVVEVFAQAPPEWRCKTERMSLMESLNMVVSLALQSGVAVEEVIRILRKGSDDKQYPAALARALDIVRDEGV